MRVFCLLPDGDGGRVVSYTADSPRETADGLMRLDDPELPDWLRNPDLPLGCYDATTGKALEVPL